MPWDYSVYPDLTAGQTSVFQKIGETLYMIQLAEHAVQLCNYFIFNTSADYSLEQLEADTTANRKRTLGLLLAEVRKYSEVHPQFDDMLREFLEKRNFFIHHMFADSDFGLTTDRQLAQVDEYLRLLQDDAWNVQNVFLGCLRNWMKETGVYEHLPKFLQQDKHLSQLDGKHFELLFRKKEDDRGNKK